MNFQIFLILNFLQIFMASVNCARKIESSKFEVNEQGLYKVGEDCVCTYIYKPVCASDGITYPNPCVLTCTRKTNPYVIGLCNGECPCCSEPYYNDPLENIDIAGFWGWDTKTGTPHQIASSELAEKPENEGKKDNLCSTPTASCICTLEYAPICGSDGNTYGNKCAFNCQKEVQPCLMQACAGACPCCPGQGPDGKCPSPPAPSTKFNSTSIA